MKINFKKSLLAVSLITTAPVVAFAVSSCSKEEPKQEYNKGLNVLWIGIDGFAANVWKTHKTPNLKDLISKSNYSLDAQDIMPSKTYPNWTGLLTSQGPNKTGITRNPGSVLFGDIVKKPTPQNNNGKGVAYSIFDAIKDQTKLRTAFVYPLIETFSLKEIVNKKSVDTMMYAKGTSKEISDAQVSPEVVKKIEKQNQNLNGIELLKLQTAYTLSKVTDKHSIYDATDLLIKNKADFTFAHVAGLDIRGHTFNWGSYEYIQYMERIDSYIGQMMKKIKEANILKNTIIVISADHGGIIGGKSHGGNTPDQRTVPIIIFDGRKQKEHNLGAISTLDVAPTIANELGLTKYKEWDGRILKI